MALPGVLNSASIFAATSIPPLDLRLSKKVATTLAPMPDAQTGFQPQKSWEGWLILAALGATIAQAKLAGLRVAPPASTPKTRTQAIQAVLQLCRQLETQFGLWPRSLWPENQPGHGVGWRIKFDEAHRAFGAVKAQAAEFLAAQGEVNGNFAADMGNALERLHKAIDRFESQAAATFEPLGGSVDGLKWVPVAQALVEGNVLGAAYLAGFQLPRADLLQSYRLVPSTFFDDVRQLREAVQRRSQLPEDIKAGLAAGLGSLLEQLEQRNRALSLQQDGVRLAELTEAIGTWSPEATARLWALLPQLQALASGAPSPTLRSELAEIFKLLDATKKRPGAPEALFSLLTTIVELQQALSQGERAKG